MTWLQKWKDSSPAFKATLVWFGVVLLCIVSVALLSHCANDPLPPPTPCLPDIIKLENESANCNEAQIKIDVLLRYSDTCRAVFGDGGFQVCGKIKDGGRDGA